MRRWLLPCFFVLALAACGSDKPAEGGTQHVAEFWRPISEPNLLMSLERAQHKLDFDISQCHCGIYPVDTLRSDMIDFESDKQRLAETSMTITPNTEGTCVQKPSLVVTECMRERGWEVTNCSGRMPLPGGGSLCTSYTY